MMILNDRLTLSFELLDKRVRLIIMENDKELACRKETIKNLQKFLTIDKANLFKGRLQLSKNQNNIEIKVKGYSIATLTLKTFEHALAEVQR